MIVGKDRLYHCHKIHKHVTIFEDYEMDEEPPRLVRCSCPYHQYMDMKPILTELLEAIASLFVHIMEILGIGS